MCASDIYELEPAGSPDPENKHSSKISEKYRNLRVTDSEPVSAVIEKLKGLDHVAAVDAGCGSYRYDLLLFKHLGDKLMLTCLDADEETQKILTKNLSKHKIDNFSMQQSAAETIPFADNSLDCICAFNSSLHFGLLRFLSESARVLKSGGYLFIYTRLPNKNERNVWGQQFSRSAQRDAGTDSLDVLRQALDTVGRMFIESIMFFVFSRMAALEQLLEHARSPRSSALSLYSAEELQEALKVFSIDLEFRFEDSKQVRWFDENILLIIKKE